LLDGNPIKWFEEIKNSNNESPKIISGITKGDELKKIKKGRPGILGILTKEYPIITPNKVAKVADKEAIFILVMKASMICSF
jgi:hypothetical protein